MPRVTVHGDAVEWARSQFLREVARHAPGVLTDLRDTVLPLRRASATHRYDHPDQASEAAPQSDEEELIQRLHRWQDRHHLLPTDDGGPGDWIAQRASRTLDEWSGHAPDALLTTEEAHQQSEARRVSAREEYEHAHLRWQQSRGEDRAKMRSMARSSLYRLRHAVVSRSIFLHFWAPPDENHAEPLDLTQVRLTNWTPEREQTVRAAVEAEINAWKRLTAGGGQKKEVAHFRWLALYQCAGIGYDRVAQYEQSWSGETLREISDIMSEDSLPPVHRKARASRVLFERGEPWISDAPHSYSLTDAAWKKEGVWPQLLKIGKKDEEADMKRLVRTLRSFACDSMRPTKGNVQQAVSALSEEIGLRRRRAGKPGRPRRKV